MSSGGLPGFRDFYPTEFAERSHITAVWRDVARRFALVEYDGPPLEPLDLYTRKSGEEIVGQLYAFEDKGGRSVALRPEMTPTLARMVGARANALRKPVRWFSIPQLFRYERQQKGRLREHFQLNVDIVGEADVTADAELLAVALEVMRAFGLTAADVRARVSDRRLLSALLARVGVGEAQRPAAFAAIDKIERDPRPVIEERLARAGVDAPIAARLYELTGVRDLDELRARFGGAADVDASLDRLDRYFAYLEALDVRDWVSLDPSIVRGLAYYTGIVFELFDARGEFRAICGGGRYDTLLQGLSGVDLPALGFGMGDVVLGDVLRARQLMPPPPAGCDFWVAGDAPELLPTVMRVATRLRRQGRSVEYALREQALARQLKTASAVGAREVVIVSSASPGNGVARIRTLADGSERTVALDDWMAGV